MYYPTNTPGTLINSFIASQKDALAAPEKTQIAAHMSRALCCDAPGSLISTAGWLITPESYKAQKSLTPYLNVIAQTLLVGSRTPVWVEYDMNTAMRGGGYLEDAAIGMKVGSLIMAERDKGGNNSLGFITILQHSDERQYTQGGIAASGIDFGANGMSICPVVSHISIEGLQILEENVSDPSFLDRIRGRNYSDKEVSKIFKAVGGLPSILSRTITTSIFEGVVIDATTLNGWNDEERNAYIESSKQISVRYAICSFLVFCLTQIANKKIIPGRVERDGSMLAWKQTGKPKHLPTLLLTPGDLGQIIAAPDMLIQPQKKTEPEAQAEKQDSPPKRKRRPSPDIPINFNKRWQ